MLNYNLYRHYFSADGFFCNLGPRAEIPGVAQRPLKKKKKPSPRSHARLRRGQGGLAPREQRRAAASAEGLAQRLLDVGDEVVDVLDADREAHRGRP